ncbi:hypothetical protein [uncultured Muribaculum sp.]|uniref:hypothetical protein n=1 Tax=uncultured Muribaculum sp. TaxID=1918613 RepID=UPI00272EEFFB|nr:hypothetical protein [uncultured Muribaculum sp.]
MKKIALFRNVNGSPEFVDRFDTMKEASDCVASIVDGEDDVTVFDFTTEEQEYTDIIERVKSYADACDVLGVPQLDEKAMLSAGFRPDEIARRKLETITAALNEGWKPDWNNTDEYKYYPWFYIEPGKGKDPDGNPYGAAAGLSYAAAKYAASNTHTNIGSRLCFHDRRTAFYAGNTFTDLYAAILVEKF